MSITIKQFEKGTVVNRSSNTSYLLEFLRKNDKKAYKTLELIKEIKKSGSMIRTLLRKLVKEKKVEKKMVDIGKNYKIPYYRAVTKNK